jgi:hypothetical protein
VIISTARSSFVVDFDGTLREPLGKVPRGYSVITPTHIIAVITGEGRKSGSSIQAKAALYNTLTAYSGEYRIEGNRLVTSVDASWDEVWNGTQQRRNFTVEGKHLTLTTDSAPFGPDPTKMFAVCITWEIVE